VAELGRFGLLCVAPDKDCSKELVPLLGVAAGAVGILDLTLAVVVGKLEVGSGDEATPGRMGLPIGVPELAETFVCDVGVVGSPSN